MLCSDWSALIFFALSKSRFCQNRFLASWAGSLASAGSKGSCDPVHVCSLTGARAARISKKK